MRAGFFTPAVVNNAPQKSGKVQVLSLNSSFVQLAASKGHFYVSMRRKSAFLSLKSLFLALGTKSFI